MNDEFMSVSEAAKQLGVSGRRIRQLIEDQELQARRIGNSWVISASEINQRKRRSPRPGRPYEQENVWKVAAFADGIAHAYVSHVAEDSSWSHALAEQQDHLASRLLNSLAEICEFNAHEVIDNSAGLAELRKLLSRAQSLSRREELLAGWMHQVANRLRDFESSAQVDPLVLSREWQLAFGAESIEAEPDARLLRSLRNMLMHRLAHEERNIASLRSRFDQAAFFYAHPSLILDLLKDSRLAYSGDHAAAQHGLDLVPGDSVDAYVRIEHADSLISHYSLQLADSLNGNVVLRFVRDFPEHHPQVAPRLFVAVDLLEEDDPRSQKAGSELLEALFASISLEQLSSRWKYSSRR